jgi:ubiquinone/menaquinone biosynthesis C-methylase UbiE
VVLPAIRESGSRENRLENPWEAAYARFETPVQEERKFVRRFRKLGALNWPRDAQIVELFCGRGNGLNALSRLGFTRLEGVDLSPTLLALYTGQAKCHVADCRRLPFADASKDILIVQGGLHHLLKLPEDLDQTLAEASRVLKEEGRLVVVEPWLTPFLSSVHFLCSIAAFRLLSTKLDALASMIHYERETYDQWLSQPEVVWSIFEKYVSFERSIVRMGKWMCIARKSAPM